VSNYQAVHFFIIGLCYNLNVFITVIYQVAQCNHIALQLPLTHLHATTFAIAKQLGYTLWFALKAFVNDKEAFGPAHALFLCNTQSSMILSSK
jgi:hypothetical protein